jgi:hypothetical protein
MRRGGEVARWRRQKTATFEDLPKRLQPREGESRERAAQRWWWLERHNLSPLDYFTWRRSQDPRAARRPPSRRKWLTPAQREALDAQLEREGPPQW